MTSATICTATAGGCSATAATSSQRHAERKPDWTAFAPFTAKQVTEITAPWTRRSTRTSPPRSRPTCPRPDAAKRDLPPRRPQVVVDNYPADSPKPLERILDRIAACASAAHPDRLAPLEQRRGRDLEVPLRHRRRRVLGRLRDAIFMADSRPPTRPRPRPAGQDPTRRDRLQDPRSPAVPPGLRRRPPPRRTCARRSTPSTSSSAQLNAIRAALAATDWAKLPSRLCWSLKQVAARLVPVGRHRARRRGLRRRRMWRTLSIETVPAFEMVTVILVPALSQRRRTSRLQRHGAVRVALAIAPVRAAVPAAPRSRRASLDVLDPARRAEPRAPARPT